ncbi:MAG TPA: acetate--CoA ligase family protein [Methylomirabilota bacterium]
MTRPGLGPFFDARSVAVIGASGDPAKVGGSVLANLRAGGFPGRLVAVNAARPVVQGLPAVPSILDVEGPIDLAVVAVPAPAVLPVLRQCVTRGVPGAVVISSGFREAGADGRAREDELRAWLRQAPLRMIGPNCLGWIRPARRLNLTFAPGMPPAGSLGFFSHSGALCTAILDWSRGHNLGFSLFASLGNQADVNETDVIAALADDADTRVILGYLEGVADGRAFFTALAAAAARKPCVLMKAGRSAEGARAVSSHTGALAGSDRAFDAAVRQAGALRVTTLEELFDVARALAAGRTPPGRRVILVTNGGGLGVLATDAARDAGLEVTGLPAPVQARLAAVLPPHAATANPVDLVGDATPARYGAALDALAGESASLVVMLAPQAATDAAGVARTVLGATRDRTAPVLGVLAGGARVRPGITALEEGGVPCYTFPERAVRALAHAVTLAGRRRVPAAPSPRPCIDRARLAAALGPARAAGRIGMLEGAPLLEAYGIDAVPARLARSPDEAAAIARAFGTPVAIKIVSPDIAHKTDVGGVVLGLASPEDVAAASARMLDQVARRRPAARLDGVLVQAMAGGDAAELLVGMVRDPQFGPLVVVGFGGIFVEILGDTATRLAPVDPAEARAMLDELRMAPALRGARGRTAVDLDALAGVVTRFSHIAHDVPDLAELEINPLLATAAGARALDVRGRIEEKEQP